MRLKIKYSPTYFYELRSLIKDNSEIESEIRLRIKWFTKNPTDERLENHELKKPLRGRWAFSITSDVRIVYRWKGKNIVEFLRIGRHKKVYKQTN